MSVVDDLADVLSSGGLGTVGTTVFKGLLPSTPDDALAVFESGAGPASVHGMARGPGTALVERPHVQVLSRAPRADTARWVAQQSVALLDALNRTINGVRYLSVYALQTPFFLERDETDRVTFAVNFEVLRVPATSS